MQAVLDYLHPKPTGEYTDADVNYIVQHYWWAGDLAGIDPLLACTQMILETGALSSPLSQRPHRNPAGIGVTDSFVTGVDFPNWKDSVHAHVGRLAAYALPVGAGNPNQIAIMGEAFGWRAFDTNRRGLGQDVETLALNWAEDASYAAKLVALANRLILVR